MIRLLIFTLILMISFGLSAQQAAITETGEEVLLYSDGTWKYVSGEITEVDNISVNETPFSKGDKSSFLVKSKKVGIGIWLNPKDWNFTANTNNPEAEYEFRLRGEDLYGMLITERLEIPLLTLREVAVDNAKSAAPDLEVVHEEYRTVNGVKVLLLQMEGTMQGIKFSYYGYYYSSAGGSVQFITYTSQGLQESYKTTCETLLNGFVEFE